MGLLLLLLAAGVASHGPKSMRERQNSSRIGNQNGELGCNVPHYTKTFSGRRRAILQPMLERLDAIYAIGAVRGDICVHNIPVCGQFSAVSAAECVRSWQRSVVTRAVEDCLCPKVYCGRVIDFPFYECFGGLERDPHLLDRVNI